MHTVINYNLLKTKDVIFGFLNKCIINCYKNYISCTS